MTTEIRFHIGQELDFHPPMQKAPSAVEEDYFYSETSKKFFTEAGPYKPAVEDDLDWGKDLSEGLLGEPITVHCEHRVAPEPRPPHSTHDRDWLSARIPTTLKRRWARPCERVISGQIHVMRGDALLRTDPLLHEVAICLYEPVLKVGIVANVLYADSRLHPKIAEKKPLYFADLLIPEMIRIYRQQGGMLSRMMVRLVGGGWLEGEDELFNRGCRNAFMTLRLLEHHRINVYDDAIGGPGARHVVFDTLTGKIVVAYEDGPGHLMNLEE